MKIKEYILKNFWKVYMQIRMKKFYKISKKIIFFIKKNITKFSPSGLKRVLGILP